MNMNINLDKLNKYIWFFLGLFITMPVMELHFGGSSLALYNLFLLFFLIIQFALNRKIYIYLYKWPIYFFLISIIGSSLYSVFIVPKEWYMTSLRAALKLAVFLGMILILSNDISARDYRDNFIKGIIVSAPIQFIWLVLQSVFWIMQRVSLNTLLFGTNYSVENGGVITLTGLSWERADTVLVFAVATVFSSNTYIRLICLLGTLLTTSRSGILMLACIYLYEIYIKIRNGDLKIEKKVKKRYIIAWIFAVLSAMILCFVESNLLQFVIGKIQYIYTRFTYLFLRINDYSSNTTDLHIQYFLWLPETLLNISPLQVLLGCGTRISGWAYTNRYAIMSTIGPWSVESDFVSLMLGNGLLGILLYYTMLYKGFMINKDKKIRAFIIMITLVGFSYQMYTSTVALMIIILCFIKKNNTN